VDPAARRYTLSADVRYGGQNYELTLPILDGELDQGFDGLVQRFNDQHLRVYGYNLNGRKCSSSTSRHRVRRDPACRWPERPAADARRNLRAGAPCWWRPAWVEALVYASTTCAPDTRSRVRPWSNIRAARCSCRLDERALRRDDECPRSRAPQPAAAAEAQASSLRGACLMSALLKPQAEARQRVDPVTTRDCQERIKAIAQRSPGG
jgi:hypothetical protein